MIEDSARIATGAGTEQTLSAELARGERGARAVIPVLRHLLASQGTSLVNEAVVARVRGMLNDLALQLYMGRRAQIPATGDASHALASLVDRLAGDEAFLAQIHNLALESHLSDRFAQKLSLDPVLSPLLQELIASDDDAVADIAMQTLAAQTRFMQGQRRMEFPLEELPAELFGAALSLADGLSHPDSAARLARLLSAYDEGATRLGLLKRLVAAMRNAAVACLAFDRAGLALFANGLAVLTGETRQQAILACSEQQSMRLVLALRAAGLDGPAIEKQLLLIGPSNPFLAAINEITPVQAKQHLAGSRIVERGQG